MKSPTIIFLASLLMHRVTGSKRLYCTVACSFYCMKLFWCRAPFYRCCPKDSEFSTDKTPPEIDLDTPTGNGIVSVSDDLTSVITTAETILLKGTVTDDLSGVASISICSNKSYDEDFFQSQCPLETTLSANSLSALTVIDIEATDRAGNPAVRSVSIHHTPPDPPEENDIEFALLSSVSPVNTDSIDCILDSMQMDGASGIEQSIYDAAVSSGKTSAGLNTAILEFCEEENTWDDYKSFVARMAQVFGQGECQHQFSAITEDDNADNRNLNQNTQMLTTLNNHGNKMMSRELVADPYNERVDVCARVVTNIMLPISEHNCFPPTVDVCTPRACFSGACKCVWGVCACLPDWCTPRVCAPAPNPRCALIPAFAPCCIPGLCLVSPECGVARMVDNLFTTGDAYCFVDTTFGDIWEKVKAGYVTLAWHNLDQLLSDVVCSAVKLDIRNMFARSQPLHPEVIALLREIWSIHDTPVGQSWDKYYLESIKINAKSKMIGLEKNWVTKHAITLGNLILFRDDIDFEQLSRDPPRNKWNSPITLNDLMFGTFNDINYSSAIRQLLHELVHVQQFYELGICTFFQNYIAQVIFEGCVLGGGCNFDQGYFDAAIEQEAYDYEYDVPFKICGEYCIDHANDNECFAACPPLSFGCRFNPCLHGGVCQEEATGISCDCSGTGYHGDLCTVKSLEIYAVSSGTDSLSIVDIVTGDQTLVGPLGPTDRFTTPVAMTKHSDGRLLVWNNSPDQDAGLAEVNKMTGAANLILGTDSVGTPSSLAFYKRDLFTAGFYKLYIIHPEPPSAGVHFWCDFPVKLAGLTATDTDTGILYGLELTLNGPPKLYSIEFDNIYEKALNCNIILLGTLSEDVGLVGSVLWLDETSVLLGSARRSQENILFDIDPDTCVVSNIRSTSQSIQGMALVDA